jgi:hypothetical protein
MLNSLLIIDPLSIFFSRQTLQGAASTCGDSRDGAQSRLPLDFLCRAFGAG